MEIFYSVAVHILNLMSAESLMILINGKLITGTSL